MKKIYMVGIIAICLIASAFAAVEGWKLLTATSTFNVVEGVEVQYYEASTGQWISLPTDNLVNIQFGTTSIKAGETDTFYLRAKNTAASGILGLTVKLGSAPYLSHTVVCHADSVGTKYEMVGNDVFVELPSDGSYKMLGFTTTAEGTTPTGQITFENYVTRQNAEPAYDNEC